MPGITNFHTHTKLCGHATGMPEDYILQAAKDGCSALGMTDHCPYAKDSPVYAPGCRMEEEQIPLYREAIRAAAKKVGFPVYYGFECEWNREFRSWYEDVLLGKYEADYLVFGCHWDSHYRYVMDLHEKTAFHDWADTTIEGIRSGIYRFVAHPDLFMGAYREWDDEAKAISTAILDAAEDCGIPVEINGNGLNRRMFETKNGLRHPYPYDEFWELAAGRKNLRIICNSDAHAPEHTILWAQDARNYAAGHGIKITETIFGDADEI